MQPCQANDTSFFEKLQQANGLDLRDNRGKRHDLAIVLAGVTVAVLSHRDGNLSSVHRHLTNHYEKLMGVLKLTPKRAVSRAQLPLILAKVSVTIFNQLIFESYGVQLRENERKWFALDGKELRGSIPAGGRRGQAVAQAVAHETFCVQSSAFYNGAKESEIPAVRKLMADSELVGQKVSLDALHCNPESLTLVQEGGGVYLVGLKSNQAELLAECERASLELAPSYAAQQAEKGHGRIEHRSYRVSDITDSYREPRWEQCQIKSLIKVRRKRMEIRSGKQTDETSYYLSNQAEMPSELCQAVRNHWRVETNNQIRDVTFKEDALRSKKRC